MILEGDFIEYKLLTVDSRPMLNCIDCAQVLGKNHSRYRLFTGLWPLISSFVCCFGSFRDDLHSSQANPELGRPISVLWFLLKPREQY